MTREGRTGSASGTITRRVFLGMSAVASAAAKLLARSAAADPVPSAPGGSRRATKKIRLSIAGYEYDRVRALIDGRVQVEGCDAEFEIASIGEMNADVFGGPQSWDVTEIGLHPFMLAYANEGFRDYSLLPVFPFRVFRHGSILICTDRGIAKPADLRGKRVATPGFSSTSLTWLRGILRHEYGVTPQDIQWVVSSGDSSAPVSGRVSRQESIVPEGLSVTRGPEGRDESDLLESGAVDALFHAVEPRAYVQGHPRVARLFPDYREVERAYFAKTGIFPIMHAVAIRNELIEANAWLPEAVFDAYAHSKRTMYGGLRKLGWATISLPWVGQEIEETRTLMGENFWPYGIEPNRKALEALFRYSHEQGLSSRTLAIEELFHPSTLALEDAVRG